MRTIYLQKDCPADLAASVATIGFFDGVHRGHQFLISHVVETAREEGRQSMIITFDQHPREVLHADYQPRLLTPLQEKLYLLERTGVDVVAVLHFDAALSQLSARDFMHDLLLERLHVAKLFIGYDHRFGHNRAEGFADTFAALFRAVYADVINGEMRADPPYATVAAGAEGERFLELTGQGEERALAERLESIRKLRRG